MGLCYRREGNLKSLFLLLRHFNHFHSSSCVWLNWTLVRKLRTHLPANILFKQTPDTSVDITSCGLNFMFLNWVYNIIKCTHMLERSFSHYIILLHSSCFQVSWVRHRDIHLLTVGRYTYTSDQRFEAMHSPHTEEWTLRVRYAQRKDSGIYECQISTTPPIGHFVYLTVVGKF